MEKRVNQRRGCLKGLGDSPFSILCPEPGTHLTVRANWQKFEVISVARIAELGATRSIGWP
jgi:hypothetical protein